MNLLVRNPNASKYDFDTGTSCRGCLRPNAPPSPWHGTNSPCPTLLTNPPYMPITRVPSPRSPSPPPHWLDINISDGQILHDSLPMHSSRHCPCHCRSYLYPILLPHPPPPPHVCIFEYCSLFCPTSWSHFHLLSV